MSNPRISRTNSMIRGSGHSLAGNRANRNSIMQGSHGRGAAAVFDLVLLEEITEDSVCHNINAMFMNDMIYSYIGNVVISVNPFRELPIYDKATIDKYRGRSAFDPKLSPHIFALADNVFNDMRYRGRDQVVIISGESGAGKTEASKKIMQYVAAVSGSTEKVNEVKNKLLNTNPVLEAFGNAKTVRNDNSSRFGKYMDIQFDFHGEPAGGFITTYLLEKARVIRQNEGERNFHIFYQLLAGGEAAKLKIPTDAKSYKYLSGGGPGSEHVKGMNDAEWFREMVKGLAAVGFSDADRKAMFEVLGAILLLGQVTFKGKASGCDANTLPPQLATLLGVPEAAIGPALTHNTVVVNRQSVASHLNEAQAVAARDTLAKAMYDRLFTWVYTRINELIAAPKAQIKAVIGVLDIYGFEILTVNSFEQFCINYCNEKLQQLFIELVLSRQQAEYASEGLKWVAVQYFDNKIICDLFDDPYAGTIALLDEQSQMVGAVTDTAFLHYFDEKLGKHAHYTSYQIDVNERALRKDKDFKLRHFAGDVVYSSEGFVEKNKDTLFQDLKRLMYGSTCELYKQLWQDGAQDIMSANKRPVTAIRTFKLSMTALVEQLSRKSPYFVRCVKPNDTKSPVAFDVARVLHQIRYLGLLENVRVRKAGYAHVMPQSVFLRRYKLACPTTWPTYRGDGGDVGAVRAIISFFKMITADENPREHHVALGKTKVFIAHVQTLVALEQARDYFLRGIVVLLQKRWRGWIARRLFSRMRAALCIQTNWRGHSARVLYRRYRAASIIAQRYKRFKLNRFCDAIFRTFAGVEKHPQLGKGLAWPEPPPILRPFVAHLQRIHAVWRAWVMVLRLTKEEQHEVRLKIIADALLRGRRDAWSVAPRWRGDHLGQFSETESAVVFRHALATIKAQEGFSKILFSALGVKMSTKGRTDRRAVVLTDKGMLRLNPDGYKQGSEMLALHLISALTIMPEHNGVAVLHFKGEGDMLFCFDIPDVVPELTAVLVQHLFKLNRKVFKVDVSANIAFTHNGALKQLRVERGPVREPTFQKTPAGATLTLPSR
eukprot:m.106072 g.106072  ORF g.106072 m.106072 type:complete len:1056 (+) comp14216_c1_seq4:94-3261(+)